MMLWLWGGLLVLLPPYTPGDGGVRFALSNLTHRDHHSWPLPLSRHPAYLKNLFRKFRCCHSSSERQLAGCVTQLRAVGITSAVYYWRARTEEQHLSKDWGLPRLS
jgi:hypothetical protein